MFSLKAFIVLIAVLSVLVEASEHRVNRNAHRRHHAKRDRRVSRRSTCPKRTASASSSVASVSVSAAAANAAVTGSASSSSSDATTTKSAKSSSSTSASASSSKASSASSSKESSSSKSSSSSSSSSKTSSSAASSSTAATTGSKLLAALFPVDNALTSWTTTSDADGSLALSDATFNLFDEITDLSHNYVQHAGKSAMQAHYPKGSFNFQHTPRGGISFYGSGPSNVDVTTAKEVTFGYSVYFPAGFDFNKGGKLPGIYAGNSQEESTSCSGGRRDDRCMSSRLMWRTDGAGEVYTYLPPSFPANDQVCDIAPHSECNPTYGASVGRGSFTFATGAWTTVSQRVKLNDVGQENGEIELFANGKSMFTASGLVLRNSADGKFRGMQVQTFFGGADSSWASPEDQDVFFSDFSMAITEKL